MADQTIPEEWQGLLDDFNRRQQLGRAMGGADKLAKRAGSGRKNAREMIALLCDKDSFMELGTLVGGVSYHGEETLPCDGVVGGLACIDGRPVVVACEDFTVKGGSIGHGANAKRLRYARLAAQEGIPYVLLLDGAGARASNTLERHPYAPNDMIEIVRLTQIAPTVAGIYGSSAGHGAISGLLMDFVVMTENATLFAAGPPLVEAATGEKLTKEALGGADIHTRSSGVAHNLAKDETDLCRQIRRYLSYLPGSRQLPPPSQTYPDREPRPLDDILQVLPRNPQKPYDIRLIIERIADSGSFFEFQPYYGKSMVCALASLGGSAVAFIANQPSVMAGTITVEAARKATQLISIADRFGLPVVFLADNPGVMSGSLAEKSGTLRAAAEMYRAQGLLKSPKLHITLRKAYGFGSSLMGMNPFDSQTISLALPGVMLGGMPVRGGDVAAGMDAETARRMQELESAASWTTADTMAFDEVIDPREMRNALIKGLSITQNRRNKT